METSRFEPGRMSRRAVLIAAGVAGLAVLGLFYWYWSQGPDPAHAGRPARAAVPVSVATASRQDVPIYLTGLGTVQALVHRRHPRPGRRQAAGGVLQGRPARQKGDVLAKIDPRLYQAALDQAKAQQGAGRSARWSPPRRTWPASRRWCCKNVETQQNVDLQQAKVDQTKASIAADDAAIETAQTNLDYTNIVAPSDGRMGVRMVDPGNIVHANDQGAIAILTQTAADRGNVHAAGADARRRARCDGARRRSRSPPTIATIAAPAQHRHAD